MLDAWQVWAGAQFFLKLPAYLRRPVTLDQARTRLAEGLRDRESLFLDKVRLDIFGYPERPYAQLMRCAGCEYGDIEALVRRDGLDATLHTLFQAGVYLSIDEFKGRRPAQRGSTAIDVQPSMLRAPRASYVLPASSSGTRSAGTPVMIDLEFIRACAANAAISLSARSMERWAQTSWESPGAGLRFRTVKYAFCGLPPPATFSQIDPRSNAIPAYFRWNLRLLRWVSTVAGRPLPWPQHAPLDNPRPIVDWLQRRRRAGEVPYVHAFTSSAVIACRWAIDNGVDISGSWFVLQGEPVTAAAIATVRRAGCRAIPRYGTMEVGAIAYGCAHGDHADDMHLVANMHGLIQAGEAGAAYGLPPKAVLITSLHAQAPFVMLNLSMGDQAEMSDRVCGCPLEKAGWTTHVWNVRSFEKLTGGGVTLHGTDVIHVLSEILPAKFGGVQTDYQLAEKLGAHGEALLELVVHPRLGELPSEAIVEEFLNALSRSDSDSMMIQRWRDAGTLQVARRPPAVTTAGKIQYLHV